MRPRERGPRFAELLAADLRGSAQRRREPVRQIVEPQKTLLDLCRRRQQPQSRACVVESLGRLTHGSPQGLGHPLARPVGPLDLEIYIPYSMSLKSGAGN